MTKEISPQSTSRSDIFWNAVIYLITGIVFLPVIHWVLTQTQAHEQLLHAFLVLAFTGTLIVFETRIKLSFRFRFNSIAQAFLVGAYAILILAIFVKISPLILISLSMVLTSLLLWVFGKERSRLIYSVMGAFTFFTGFALLMPFLDWPLRSIAGQCASAGLNALGGNTSLGVLQNQDPMLILFSSGKPFHVAAECNGFGIITSALLMATILLLYFKAKWQWKVSGLLIALFIGLFFNSLRIVIIVLIAPHLGDDQYLLMHEIVGIITTYSGLGILYFSLSNLLNKKRGKSEEVLSAKENPTTSA